MPAGHLSRPRRRGRAARFRAQVENSFFSVYVPRPHAVPETMRPRFPPSARRDRLHGSRSRRRGLEAEGPHEVDASS